MPFLLLCVFIPTFWLNSCVKDKKASQPKSLVPPDGQLIAGLGQGYDPISGRVLPRPCVKWEGDPTFLQMVPESAEIVPGNNVSTEEVLKLLSGSLSLTYPVYPGVTAGANVNLAISSSATKVSKNVSLYQNVRYEKKLPAETSLSEQGKEVVRLIKSRNLQGLAARDFFFEKCGREFVNLIHYGANLLLLVDFNFGSELNKAKFGVGLKLELLGGIASIEVDANVLKDKFAETTTVGLHVKQSGGDPNQIARIFPDGLPKCRYSLDDKAWSTDCANTITAILNYATGRPDPKLQGVTSFHDQLTLDKLIPIAYETIPYLNVEVDGFIKSAGLVDNQEIAKQVEGRKIGIQLLFQELTEVGGFIRSLQASLDSNAAYADINAYPAYFAIMIKQIGIASEKRRALAGELESCWKDLVSCQEARVQTKLSQLQEKFPYDPKVTEYGGSIPTLSTWCSLLGGKGLGDSFPQNQIINGDTFRTSLMALFTFANVTPPSTNADPQAPAQDLAEKCNELQTRVMALPELNLTAGNTGEQPIQDLRIFDQNPGLRLLSVKNQSINDIPRFYGLPRLQVLDLGGNPFPLSEANLISLREVSAKLKCLDITSLTPKVAQSPLLTYLRSQVLIARNLGLSNFTDLGQGATTIIADSLSKITASELQTLGNTINGSLKIYVRKPIVPLGTYGKISVENDDGLKTCATLFPG